MSFPHFSIVASKEKGKGGELSPLPWVQQNKQSGVVFINDLVVDRNMVLGEKMDERGQRIESQLNVSLKQNEKSPFHTISGRNEQHFDGQVLFRSTRSQLG